MENGDMILEKAVNTILKIVQTQEKQSELMRSVIDRLLALEKEFNSVSRYLSERKEGE